MKQYKFKTDINCGGCVATVTPHLDEITEIDKWYVDTEDKRKILTVDSMGAGPDVIITAVQQAGFTIEPLKKGLLGKLL